MAHDIFVKSYLNFLKKNFDEGRLENFIEEVVAKGKLAGSRRLEETVASAFDRTVSIVLTHFYHYILLYTARYSKFSFWGRISN